MVPYNLYLINTKDNISIKSSKVLIIKSFPISFLQHKYASKFCREPRVEINEFLKRSPQSFLSRKKLLRGPRGIYLVCELFNFNELFKLKHIILSRSDKGLRTTVVNSTFPLEITLKTSSQFLPCTNSP